MDITGYPHHRSSLLQSTVVQRRRPGKQRPLSLGAKALTLLALLVLGWAGFRHGYSRRRAAAAAASAEAASKQQAAAAGSGGASAGSAGKVGAQPAGHAESASDALLRSRAERAMRLIPSYRGPGRAETFPFFGNANRLLLASHGRLMWYRYDIEEVKVLQDSQGEHLFYGAFPGAERGMLGEPASLWVVAAPFSPQGSAKGDEWLLQLDAESGLELGRVKLPSSFTHDAVRRRDRVYVASTDDGRVLEFDFPDLKLLRELPLFSRREHVSSLGPHADGRLWAVLHNQGDSQLVEVDLGTGKEVRRLPTGGRQSHGLVFWQDHSYLTLDSEGGALLLVDSVSGQAERLWQLGEAGHYLKGLCVVDDVAFFGIAPSQPRARRADPDLSCELAAFDLQHRLLLWRRVLPTKGLLNLVAAPHLTVESTTYPVQTRPLISYKDKPVYAAALEAAQKAAVQEMDAHGVHAAKVADQQQEQHGQAAVAANVQQAQQLAEQQQGQQANGQQQAEALLAQMVAHGQEQGGSQQQQAAANAQQAADALQAHAQEQQLQQQGNAGQEQQAANAQQAADALQAHAQEQQQQQQGNAGHEQQAANAQQAADALHAQAQEQTQGGGQQQQAAANAQQAADALHAQVQDQAQQGDAQEQQAAANAQQAADALQGQAEHAQDQATEQAGQQQQQQQQQHGEAVAHQRRKLAAWAEQEEALLRPQEGGGSLPSSLVDGQRWSSGLPRLHLGTKGSPASFAGGAHLRLGHADVRPLREALTALSEEDWGEERQREANAWLEGRQGNLRDVKPGADSILLLFSDRAGQEVLRFPWFDRFRPALEPLLVQVLGRRDAGNLMRLQLARLPPRGRMVRHTDSGGYAERGHRIHVVLQTNAGVSIQVCGARQQADLSAAPASPDCRAFHAEEGLAFELDNRLPHSVTNAGDEPRIHLVMDVAESPRAQRPLRAGEVCRYGGHGDIACPDRETEAV